MDRVERYRQIIYEVLSEYAKLPYAYGDIQRQLVCDSINNHYLLLSLGWDQRRVHGCLAHVDIIDGKFWIQRDGTEYSIALELVDRGVPKEHIVLAFRRPEVRTYTGFATGSEDAQQERLAA